MTIHGPGTPITAAEIQAEFGGANPFYISNYYAGGPNVPAGTAGTYGAIPASGAISLQHFYGATKGSTLVVGQDGTTYYGYVSGGTVGSLTPNTAWSFGANPIFQIIWYPSGQMNLSVNNGNANSGWTTMRIGAGAYNRTSAAYQNNANIMTNWVWQGIANPFPAVGQSVSVSWV